MVPKIKQDPHYADRNAKTVTPADVRPILGASILGASILGGQIVP